MIDSIKRWLGANPWPTAVVLCVVLASLATVYAVSSGEQRDQMLVGVGALGGVVLAAMRGLGQRSDNGNAPALLLAAGLGAATLSGCATWADTARHTLEGGAHAVELSDRALAAAIHTECAHARGDAAAVDACLADHGFDAARTAVHVGDAGLRTGQATVDAVEHVDGGEAQWMAALPCVAQAVVSAVVGVEAVTGTIAGVGPLVEPLRLVAGACAPEGSEGP